jgi:hypothetical protein
MRLIAAAVVTTDIVSFNALAISKIQVHRDRGNEFADRRRFALAANIEDYLGNPQSPRQRGTKVTFKEGPVLAQSSRSLSSMHERWRRPDAAPSTKGWAKGAMSQSEESTDTGATADPTNDRTKKPDPCASVAGFLSRVHMGPV